MSILCTLKNIHLTFGTKEIFKNANFTIHSDAKIGLLGLNGQGKSSLLKILAGEVEPDPSTPAFQFDKSKGEDNIKYNCFYIPQELPLTDIEGGQQDYTIQNYFFRFYPEYDKIQKSGDIDLFQDLGVWDLIASYESYLKYFGLTDLDKKLSDLSGGEQKKILLSLGFSAKSSLVLWDEPTNHLDLETIKLFEERLKSEKTAFILISHDRHLLSSVTNQIFHIALGTIVSFKGNYLDYLVHLQNQEEANKKLISKLKNSLTRETAWMRQGIKARGTRSKKRVENYLDLRDTISTLKSQARKELNLHIANSGRKTKCLVNCQNVSFRYDNQPALFNHINLSLNKFDKIGLMGINGVGKTTLVKLIIGEVSPTTGHLKRAEDLNIFYFSQMRKELNGKLTPAQFLGEGNDQLSLPDGRTKHIAAYFESFLFKKDQLHRPINTFSGGEKNRLQLAKNLLNKADLWIFDEPTNDLDLETLQILEQTLTKFKGSLILISHDRSFLSNVTNKIWLLKNNTMEGFEAGYEQAEAFLEATSFENLLKNDEKESKNSNKKSYSGNLSSKREKQKVKLSYNEKKQLKRLPSLIIHQEKIIETIEDELSNIDYTSSSKEQVKKLRGIDNDKQIAENKLLALYEELESLESRI
jgi:ABC transport system ATP-binding/permease protein